MPPALLNLKKVRVAVGRAGERAPSAPLASQGFTRRAFLLGAAASGAGVAGAKALPENAFRFEYDGRTARFMLAGTERWVIDPSRFCGAPRLNVVEKPEHVIVSLHDARFPGTGIPADLKCECRLESGRWRMRMAMAFASFGAEADLLSWLTGNSPIRARRLVRQQLEETPLKSFRVILDGVADLAFQPDWILTMAASGIAQVSAGVAQVIADVVELRLGTERRQSFMLRPSLRSSHVTFPRGDRAWDLGTALPQPPAGELVLADDHFASLTATLDENECGDVRAEIRPVEANGVSLAYRPGDGINGPNERPLAFRLRHVVIALAASREAADALLMAHFDREPSWLAIDDLLLQLGDAENDTAFEIHSRNGNHRSFKCAPVLIASLIPLEGAMSESTPPPCDTRVAIHHEPPKGSDWGSVAVCGETPEMTLSNCCISVVRPQDLMNVCFEMRDVRIRKRFLRKPLLEPSGKNPILIVHFPPQSILERAFLEESSGAADCPTDPPVDSRLSGGSRLAFHLPLSGEIPFTLESLLGWSRMKPVLVDETRAIGDIKAPELWQTAIEAPYRLTLSPEAAATWQHAVKPATIDGRSELWHTRLTRIENESEIVPHVRAVWSPDFQSSGADPAPVECPFRASLNPRDRHRIVRLTHDAATNPIPVDAKLLALSSLGAWLDLHGFWPFSTAREEISLEKWEHVATMGRDQHVIVENRGFLYPFGHMAVLIKETERKIEPTRDVAGRPVSYVAYLRQRKFIVVKERTKQYVPCADFSFESITFIDDRTPPLDPIHGIRKNCATTTPPAPPPPPKPGECQSAANDCFDGFWCESAFWPMVAGKPFRFRLEGVDRAGNTIPFDAPLIFIEDRVAKVADCIPKSCGDVSQCEPQPMEPFSPRTVLPDVACEYREDTARRTSDLRGQAVAVSKPIQKNDTEIEGLRVLFFHADSGVDRPPFRPIIDRIEGRVPALEAFTPGSGTAWLVLEDPEKEGNASQTFAFIVPDENPQNGLTARFDGQSDRSGGIAAPRPNITQLSRTHGPTTEVAATGPNDRRVMDSFFDPNATLFGTIPLSAIIDALDFNVPETVPAILAKLTPWYDGFPELSQSVAWRTDQLRPVSVGGGFLTFDPRAGAVLSIDAKFQLFLLSDSPARFSSKGELSNFDLALEFSGSGIRVGFNAVRFFSSTDAPSNVEVDIRGVDFTGALAFVQQLQKYLKLPADIEVDLQPDGLTVRMPPLKVPSISLGVFALEDLVIESSLRIPFQNEEMVLSFSFGAADRPFHVTVGVFSGGGFFAVDVTSRGLRRLAAAFEFGAMKSLSFGVAHGRLYVMGGLFYSQENSPRGFSVTYMAYVRAGGELHALGCISFGVDLYLALASIENGQESYLFGTATLTYSFEIGFIKKSFSITHQQRFAGSRKTSQERSLERTRGVVALSLSGDVLGGCDEDGTLAAAPRFEELMPESEWKRYWNAFAT